MVTVDMISELLDLFVLLSGPQTGPFGPFRYWYMDRKTQDWPIAPVTIANRRKKNAEIVSLSFTYSVGGEIYGGYQECKVQDPAPAVVRYDPKRPERSWIP
jgi:hypothetical protein